jgi:fucose 4-O-acetylase-like acetyltransferase
VKSKSVKKYGSIGFIKKRAVRLLIPYLVLSLIGIVPKFMVRNYINDTVELNTMYFVRGILVPRKCMGTFLVYTNAVCVCSFNVASYKISKK